MQTIVCNQLFANRQSEIYGSTHLTLPQTQPCVLNRPVIES